MSGQAERSDIKCVAVIQCHIAHERCTGSHCAITFARREGLFAGYPADAIYVPFTCGGCPGRRISRLMAQLKDSMRKKLALEPGRIAVHLSSCVVNDSGHYPPCPHVEYMKAILSRKGCNVVEGSYISQNSERRRQEGLYASRPE
jgi:predicted metal-binding protein